MKLKAKNFKKKKKLYQSFLKVQEERVLKIVEFEARMRIIISCFTTGKQFRTNYNVSDNVGD